MSASPVMTIRFSILVSEMPPFTVWKQHISIMNLPSLLTGGNGGKCWHSFKLHHSFFKNWNRILWQLFTTVHFRSEARIESFGFWLAGVSGTSTICCALELRVMQRASECIFLNGTWHVRTDAPQVQQPWELQCSCLASWYSPICWCGPTQKLWTDTFLHPFPLHLLWWCGWWSWC